MVVAPKPCSPNSFRAASRIALRVAALRSDCVAIVFPALARALTYRPQVCKYRLLVCSSFYQPVPAASMAQGSSGDDARTSSSASIEARSHPMFSILGATGRIGGTAARELRAQGQPVRAVVRDAGKAASLVEL